MAELKPCPFCGGEAAVGDVLTFTKEGKSIKCTKCHARSMYVLIDSPKVNHFDNNTVDESTRYTAEQAVQKAAEYWNRRVPQTEVHQYGENCTNISNCGTLNLNL